MRSNFDLTKMHDHANRMIIRDKCFHKMANREVTFSLRIKKYEGV